MMFFLAILDLDLLILSIVEQLYIKENRLNLDYCLGDMDSRSDGSI